MCVQREPLPGSWAPGSCGATRPQPPAVRQAERSEKARGGCWGLEKQTLFSAHLWQEGSRGPQARGVKQFQTGTRVCFSLEQRLKTPKALGSSCLNILFWKVLW